MAKIASKNSEVWIEGSSESPIKLTACRSWNINTEAGTIDVGTIGTEWKEFLIGQKSVSGDIELLFDNESTGGNAVMEAALIAGTPITVYMCPEGKVTGKMQYSFSAYVTSWNISGATEDAITIAVNFQGTGAIAKGTVSA